MIITIGRQYGSGGRRLAQMLSEHFNIPLYDKDLINRVSEETGIISIAVDGKITRNYNSVTAIAELQRLLLTEDGNKATSNIVTVIKNINPFAKNKERKDD